MNHLVSDAGNEVLKDRICWEFRCMLSHPNTAIVAERIAALAHAARMLLKDTHPDAFYYQEVRDNIGEFLK